MTNNNMSTIMNLTEWVVALRRRSTLMVLIFSTVTVLALLTAFLWPATYQASGTILIEQQELPSDLVRSTISSYADQRIQVIRQQVMTTEKLFNIIQKYDLYPDERKKKPREFVLNKMKADMGFNMISADVIDPRSGNPTKATIAFAISFKHRSANLAAKVANEMVSLYLQQNIDSRKQHTADATGFLNDEADRLNKDITVQQATLEEYKNQHVKELPEQAQLNMQLMNRNSDDLRAMEARLSSLAQQAVYLDGQLAQLSPSSQVYTSTGERVLSPSDRLKFLRTELARVSGLYSTDHPDVLRMQREIAGLEAKVGESLSPNELRRQFNEATTKLAVARERYSTQHPDVTKLQRTVDALQSQLQQASVGAAAAVTEQQTPDNPAYIQIKAQREANAAEQTSLFRQRNQLQQLAAEYERRLTNSPAVEREYSTMLRDLENNQLKYREVRQKQLEAEVSQNMENERKGERFTLIEPPLTPEEPYSPNRIIIIVLGMMLAVAAAMAALVLLEVNTGSVRNRRDLEALLSVPPLAILPWIDTQEDRVLRSRHRRYTLIGATASVILAATMLHLFFRPLDVLWHVALRRLTG
ncbi:MAG: lipopolysaccharide biosynthesis protein [Steroidobacteraceae bacterium]